MPGLFTGVLDEIRSALRSFLASPLFSAVAILSLALGIGANTAIFSLIDQVILQPLPIQRPGELVQLYQQGSHYGSNSGPRMHSYPMYKDFRDQSPVFEGVIARREIGVTITFNGSAERTQGELVSGNYFNVLGVKAHIGRVFTPTDDKTKSAHPLAVLSYDYWKTRFSSDSNILNQEILVNNHKLTVIGVSAPEFFGLDPTRTVALRVPIAMKPQMTPSWDAYEDRRSRWVQVFARLKPGISLETAQAQLLTQFRALRAEEVKDAAFARASDYSKQQFLKGTIHLEQAANGYSGLRRQVAQPLWILMGIVGLVLLIACTNVANLLIARASARRKEFAVRVALGASRWRLMRPLLVESVLLSCLGGALGLLLAVGLNSLLISFMPPSTTPYRVSAGLDLRVLGFTFGVACCTGILFGLFPAFGVANTDAAPALKEEGRGMSAGGRAWIRKTLVGVQVSLSILLLIAAGLFVRTLQNLKLADTGLQLTRLVTFQAEPGMLGYDVTKIKNFSRDLKQRLESMPGVTKAGVATIAKMSGNEWDMTVTVEGFKHEAGQMPGPYFDAVTPGYVEAMGMKILSGRDFRDSDAHTEVYPEKPDPNVRYIPYRVCLINKKFADKFFAGRNPVGYHIGLGGDPGTPTTIEIVGVFSDAKYMNLRDEVPYQVLVPYYQLAYTPSVVAYVRTTADEASFFPQVRATVKSMDAQLPIYAMRSFEDQVDTILSTERMLSFLATIFGVIATILAAIGLYGVLALSVAKRQKEIGIRIALGAAGRTVVGLVLGEIAFLILGGILVGVPAAIGLSKYLESQLYGMKATDPITFALAVSALIGVALLASYWPTRRATKVNPIEVLRYE